MRCFSPINAFQLDDGRVVFAERGAVRRPLTLRCGQCIGCRLKRSKDWAIRCMHEVQMHPHSSFITLTYDSLFLPDNGSLTYQDFQRFMYRVRKKFGKVRFFMCGEYGEKGRPHFHAILFGLWFADREYFRTLPSGHKIYRSACLEALWPFGYCSIGEVSFESAAYVARYICKKVTGDSAEDFYKRVNPETGEVFNLTPEFCHMSLKPGIGRTWFDKFGVDVFPQDSVVMDGKKHSVPKYYDRLLRLQDAFVSDDVEYDRIMKAAEHVDDCSPERLAVQEHVARARLSLSKRKIL